MVFGINDLRDILRQLNSKEISMSKALEMLNEKAGNPKWKNLNQSRPVCYKNGEWDGLQSDLFVIETSDRSRFLARAYEGVMDGRKFFSIHEDGTDGDLTDVAEKWLEIPIY